jgi:UDP-N-acetyl-D-galactosamine dehydrogenase
MLDFEKFVKNKGKVCVVGLGYVGLPLAVLLSERFPVLGFDVNHQRTSELSNGYDRCGEVTNDTLRKSSVQYTSDATHIQNARVIIITVPTPVSEHNSPDLSFLENASQIVGKQVKAGTVVVYESTVYPGVTEEICAPILERESKLHWKRDFHVGYSPERVNPGDSLHSIDKIVKVVSGDTPEITDFLARFYGEIIVAGIHSAPNIRTAEAAKVIENIQRDLNIALINELALIFQKMSLDTREVLEAASTKWNFLKFEPGLVGGHCIGVDPYYLTFKAEELGYHPDVILAGRRINDSMGKYIAEQTVKLIIRASKVVKNCKILVMGVTFKENVPDVRNSKTFGVIEELKEYGAEVFVFDPLADKEHVYNEYGIQMINDIEQHKLYDAVVLAVGHESFVTLESSYFREISNGLPIIVDVKGICDKSDILSQEILYWRL